MKRDIGTRQDNQSPRKSKRSQHTAPYLTGKGWTLHRADVLQGLRALPDRSVHCIVTSPPYWGLRDYSVPPSVWGGNPSCKHRWAEHVQPAANGTVRAEGMSGKTLSSKSATRKPMRSAFCQRCGAWRGALGLEPTPELYVEHLVMIFREVRRVLRDDGTLWLNMGDCYAGGGRHNEKTLYPAAIAHTPTRPRAGSLKTKDLVGIPWRVALALQADGWVLRSDVIWHKPNPMPESVRDRPTKSHEYLFLLTKSPKYHYDAQAIREPGTGQAWNSVKMGTYPKLLTADAHEQSFMRTRGFGTRHPDRQQTGRNKRSVWTIAPQPFPGVHFATFPEKLVEPCVLAGTSAKGCCPTCGAPHARVVRKQRYATRPGRTRKVDSTGLANRDPKRHCTDTTTLGWQPCCACKAATVKPCVVLDPFAGTSTTGLVALRHGRRYVGIELSRKFCQMSKQRLQTACDGRESAQNLKKQKSREAA